MEEETTVVTEQVAGESPDAAAPDVKPQSQPSVSDLERQYREQLAEARQRFAQREKELRQREQASIQQIPDPQQRSKASEDYWRREAQTALRERDIYRAHVETGIPLAELEQAENPDDLDRIIRIRKESDEVIARLSKLEQNFRSTLSELEQKLREDIREEIIEEYGLNRSTRGGGTAPHGELDRRIAELEKELERAAGTEITYSKALELERLIEERDKAK